MPTIDAAHAFALDVSRVRDREGLADLLQEACARMGCSWFALSHHIDFLAAPDRGVRVHNYPEEWALWFDEQRLGVTDPVPRESSSEEHTSELQSLMRISYAVFCLQKKKKT